VFICDFYLRTLQNGVRDKFPLNLFTMTKWLWFFYLIIKLLHNNIFFYNDTSFITSSLTKIAFVDILAI